LTVKWSWKIGEISGIGIYLHGTFLILLAWVGLIHILRGNDLADTLHGLTLLIALFGIVVLHELGHALAARRYGISTRDITLLPIGGVARMERMPDDPKQELVVALAGPAVNVVLAVACALGIVLLVGAGQFHAVLQDGWRGFRFFANSQTSLDSLSELPLVGAIFLAKLFVINSGLVIFNLIPAFPMDGGRVLRASLALRMDYVQATQVAASLGQAMALLFGFLGLFSFNPFLVFIALFVWMGAAAEASMVQIRSALGGIPVRQAMITDFQTVSPHNRLEEVAAHVIAGFQQDFPVLDDQRLVGMLMRVDLLKALAEHGAEERVSTVMRRDFRQADPSEMLEGVFGRLHECDCHSLPVVQGTKLVGVIDMENVGEFIALHTALRRERGGAKVTG
jgi:Zn-dependent protease